MCSSDLAVLPCGEPEEDESFVVLSGLQQERIDEREVELVFLGFDLFPIDRDFQGVGVEVFDGLPELWQQGGPCARIVGLSAQHEEGFAVDEEGVAAVLFDKRGHLGIAGLGEDVDEGHCQAQAEEGCLDQVWSI